jgi:hypothetical protein
VIRETFDGGLTNNYFASDFRELYPQTTVIK